MNAHPASLLALALLLPSPLLAQGSLAPLSGKPTPTMKSLEELWDQADGLQSDVDRLDSKVDAIAGDVTGLETQMSGLDRDMASLATQLGSVESQVSGLEAQVSALETQNASLANLLFRLGLQLGAIPWEITIVDGEGYVGYGASMALNPAGEPAIAYFDPDDGLMRFAQYNGTTGEWDISGIMADTRSDLFYLSLAFVPSDGEPAVAYLTDDGSLKLARHGYLSGHSKWFIETVDAEEGSFIGQYRSLTYGPTGDPAISYYAIIDSGGELRYAVREGGVWQVTVVDSGGIVGQYSSLAFSPSGHPTIAYYDFTNKDLKLAWHDGAAWQVLTVDSDGEVGQYASLAFTSQGDPAIAYYEASNENLRYLVYYDPYTIFKTVVDAGEYVGLNLSLAFSPTGFPAISYYAYEAGQSELRIATFNGSIWQKATVDAGIHAYFTSLLFLPSGQPAIAYSEIDVDELRFAVRVSFAAP